MPSSEANFVNLYINDTLWGLYTNVEAVNKEFVSKYYYARDNAFFKCNPDRFLVGDKSSLILLSILLSVLWFICERHFTIKKKTIKVFNFFLCIELVMN